MHFGWLNSNVPLNVGGLSIACPVRYHSPSSMPAPMLSLLLAKDLCASSAASSFACSSTFRLLAPSSARLSIPSCPAAAVASAAATAAAAAAWSAATASSAARASARAACSAALASAACSRSSSCSFSAREVSRRLRSVSASRLSCASLAAESCPEAAAAAAYAAPGDPAATGEPEPAEPSLSCDSSRCRMGAAAGAGVKYGVDSPAAAGAGRGAEACLEAPFAGTAAAAAVLCAGGVAGCEVGSGADGRGC